MIENFSDRVKEVFTNSKLIANNNTNMYITPAHCAAAIFQNLSKNMELILKELNANINDVLYNSNSLLIRDEDTMKQWDISYDNVFDNPYGI